MEKRLSPIFVALDIVLRTKDKVFFIRAIAAFSLSLCVLLLLCMTMWELLGDENSKWWLVALFVACSVIFGYFISLYALSPLFKTNRLLDILLKDTLHELNIPLSVIKANLQMLQNEEMDEKRAKRLDRISLASDDLHLLYKEVDYYIKREIREEIKEVFNLLEVVTSVIKKLEDVGHGVKIIHDVSPIELFTDKHGFAKVISNLLSNAMKYNYNNADIHISQKENLLIIKDDGVGMSEAELFLVFDRYYQVDSSKDGHGIGLSIVKAYCDDFKILMSIRSKKNEGTMVTLDISNLIHKK